MILEKKVLEGAVLVAGLVAGATGLSKCSKADLTPLRKRIDRLEDKVDKNHKEIIKHLLKR